jgi:hypothetical protein
VDVQRTCLLIAVSSGAQKIFGSGYGCPEDMSINSCLLRSPKDHSFRGYGCPEDMSINSCLLRSPKDYWFRVSAASSESPARNFLIIPDNPKSLESLSQTRSISDLSLNDEKLTIDV